MISLLEVVGNALANFLTKPRAVTSSLVRVSEIELLDTLRPADVLLVDGNQRISTAIKYLTQSTWSHAALYGGAGSLIEADLKNGVVRVPLAKYSQMHTRICRPIGLTSVDSEAVIRFAVSRLGHAYDLKNVFDLARYLLPTPPVPSTWRRSLLALGSGSPTRAICSTLIAEAFQSIKYPILPTQEAARMRVRHHSLFTPRDFDISPFFEIVKPTLAQGFDYRRIEWADGGPL